MIDMYLGDAVLRILWIINLLCYCVSLYMWWKWGMKAPTNGRLATPVIVYLLHVCVYSALLALSLPFVGRTWWWVSWTTGLRIHGGVTFVLLGWTLFRKYR